MGVRFQCPQGHSLHVKAHLAGKRGICPDCGARFIVPSFSSGRVPAVDSPSSSLASGPDSRRAGQSESTVVAAAEAATTPDGGPQATRAALENSKIPLPEKPKRAEPPVEQNWYLRGSDAVQYGPADAETFRRWIDEGRVAADSLVWRTGWEHWKSGADASRILGASIHSDDDPSDRSIVIATLGESSSLNSIASNTNLDPSAIVLEASSPSRRTTDRRRRRRRRQMMTFWLALAAVTIAAVLAVVLARN